MLCSSKQMAFRHITWPQSSMTTQCETQRDRGLRHIFLHSFPSSCHFGLAHMLPDGSSTQLETVPHLMPRTSRVAGRSRPYFVGRSGFPLHRSTSSCTTLLGGQSQHGHTCRFSWVLMGANYQSVVEMPRLLRNYERRVICRLPLYTL